MNKCSTSLHNAEESLSTGNGEMQIQTKNTDFFFGLSDMGKKKIISRVVKGISEEILSYTLASKLWQEFLDDNLIASIKTANVYAKKFDFKNFFIVVKVT